MTDATEPAADVDDPAGQDSADAVNAVGVVEDNRGQAASTLDVVLAQTAGSSDPEDLDDVAGTADDGRIDVACASDSSDLTAGIVLVDDPTAWPGQLVGSFGGDSTVGTVSSNAAGAGPPTGWQRVATGFLLGYAGASRAAYAADLRDYLTWWADTAIPDHPGPPCPRQRPGQRRRGRPLPRRWRLGALENPGRPRQ